MELVCKFCQKELKRSESGRNYFSCRFCRLTFPQPDSQENGNAQPTKYALQFFDEAPELTLPYLLKESIVLDPYVIDYRPWILDFAGETVIGKFFWDERFSIVNYEDVIRIPGKAFDFTDLEQARQRLRILLTFS